MSGLWRDIRLGVRSLIKSPGFALIALVTLALGIGANTAIFSVVDAVLLRPLPYPNSNRLVAIYTTDPAHNSFRGSFSYTLYRRLRPAVNSLTETGAYSSWPFTITRPGEPSLVLGALAIPSFLPMLGVRPMLGHLYTAAEAQSAQPVAVISEHLWRKRFHAGPAIIGHTIELDHRPYSIVGVLPSTARFPMLSDATPPDVWIPLSSANLTAVYGTLSGSLQSALPTANQASLEPDQVDFLRLFGRLKGAATPAQVAAASGAVVKRFSEAYPAQKIGTGARVVPLAQEVEKGYRTALLLLFGAVGLVLLVACANVANLLVARAASREREMALRMALGGGRRRIVRQMLVESVELSLAGGAVGAYLAYLTVTNLGYLVPSTLTQVRAASLNGHVLLFAAAVSILAGVLFGSLPVWGIGDLKIFETLKEGGRGLSGGARHRLRNTLAVIEVALAVILLVGSGLLLHSFMRVTSVNPGYKPHGVLLAQLNLPTRTYSKPDQWRNLVTAAVGRLRAQPGVREAAVAVSPPVAQEGIALASSYNVVGHPLAPNRQPQASIFPVGPGYFRLMGIPLLRGRAFTASDLQGSTHVCIVSRNFAEAEFGGKSPLGERLRLTKKGAGREIVGVVGNVHQGSLTGRPPRAVYLPFAQFPFPYVSFLVRTSLPPASAESGVRAVLHDAAPDVPLVALDPMEQLLSRTIDEQRFRTLLVGMFAGLAILLAAVGISGVLGYSVSRRRQEIGVRMALGATPNEVLRLVLKEGLRLVGIGAALGLVAAFALTRLMSNLLYGTSPADALTYAGVAVMLLLVGLVACAVPALRATRVEPTVALRYE